MKVDEWYRQLDRGKLQKTLLEFRDASVAAGWADLSAQADALLSRFSRSKKALIEGMRLEDDHSTESNRIEESLRGLLRKYGDRQRLLEEEENWVDGNDPALAAFQLAQKERENGALQQALRLFSEAIRLAPLFAEAYVERGNTKCMMPGPDVPSALEDYNEALKLQPGNPMALVNRGLLYLSRLNDRAKACDDWSAAAEAGDPFARQFLQQYCR